MRTTNSVAAAALLLAVGALSGCGGGSSSAGPSGSPSLSLGTSSSPPAPASSAPAKPKPTGIPTAYPKSGVVFDKFPTVHGTTKAALQALVDYEASSEQALRQLRPNPEVRQATGDSLFQGVQNNIAALKQNRLRYAGTLRISDVKVVGHNDRLVIFDVCLDASHERLASTNGGASKPLEGSLVGPARLQVSLLDPFWKVTSETLKDGPC